RHEGVGLQAQAEVQGQAACGVPGIAEERCELPFARRHVLALDAREPRGGASEDEAGQLVPDEGDVPWGGRRESGKAETASYSADAVTLLLPMVWPGVDCVDARAASL